MVIFLIIPSALGSLGRTLRATAHALRPGRRVVSTLTGLIRRHDGFPSRILGTERTILVYLPPGYQREERRYPVLYLHDGQNVFDAATSFSGVEWGADETAQRLIMEGRMQPIIMVAVYHQDRVNEYTPVMDVMRKEGGQGELYARFLAEELKPFIDENYRTLPEAGHTAVAGSSLGGLISLYLAAGRPQVFGMCAALSPSLSWSRGWILRYLLGTPGWAGRVRFWVDMGTREGRDLESFRHGIMELQNLEGVFRARGLAAERDYHALLIAGGRHHERDWARRFDQVLLYLFGG